VAASGVDILSLKYGDMYGDGVHTVADKYYIASGTSMAAPHVAGLASLILSKHPEFTNDEIVQVIRQSTDDIESSGWDVYSGYGRINAEKALKINSVCVAKIIEPYMKSVLRRENVLNIKISASGTNFNNYVLDYGKGETPSSWTTITSSSFPVIDGYVASLNLNNLDFTQWTIRLIVTDTKGQTFEDRVVFSIAPPLLSGWPVTSFVIGIDQSPTIADINDDGYKEVIVGSDRISAYNYKGELLFNTPDSFYTNEQSVAKLYSSIPGKEITGMIINITELPFAYNFSYNLHLLKKDGSEIGGWPKELCYVLDDDWGYPLINKITEPIIADINNDGKSEIIQQCIDKIFVLNSEGNIIQGWPVIVNSHYFSIAVGNIDDDPELEIVVAITTEILYDRWYSIVGTVNKLLVLQHNGVYDPRWPVKTFILKNNEIGFTGWLYDNNPVLVDLNQDGLDEIIVKVPGKGVYAFNGDGTDTEGSWPVVVGGGLGTYPVVADINKDGRSEIVIAGGEKQNLLYAINHDGTIANGWPREMSSMDNSPVVGDIDGDGYMEIVVVSFFPHVQIFRYDGSIFAEWDIPDFFSFTSPALGDLDKDGDLDLIVTGTNIGTSRIYAYDLGTKSLTTPWPMLGNDEKHQHRYVHCKLDGTDIFNGMCYKECGASLQCDKLFPGTGCCSRCYYVDITSDGAVDGSDLIIVSRAFGSYPGHPNWNSIADINKDGAVDGSDSILISRKFGVICTSPGGTITGRLFLSSTNIVVILVSLIVIVVIIYGGFKFFAKKK
jgi:hypothetical protein